MSDPSKFTTIEQARARTYGASYSPRPYVEGRCCESVRGQDRWPSFYQCTRPNGHGPSGLFCKQHDPKVVEARRAAIDAKYRAESDAASRKWKRERLAREIADMAVKAFRQEAPFDDMAPLVREYAALAEDKG